MRRVSSIATALYNRIRSETTPAERRTILLIIFLLILGTLTMMIRSR